jgi:hypothetical protein
VPARECGHEHRGREPKTPHCQHVRKDPAAGQETSEPVGHHEPAPQSNVAAGIVLAMQRLPTVEVSVEVHNWPLWPAGSREAGDHEHRRSHEQRDEAGHGGKVRPARQLARICGRQSLTSDPEGTSDLEDSLVHPIRGCASAECMGTVVGKVNFTPICAVPDPPPGRVVPTAPPLAATLARVASRSERWRMRLGHPTTPEWVPATAIAEQLDDLLVRVGKHYGTADPAVTGTFFLKGYARGAAAAALICLATERRVPDVTPDNVAFRFGPDGIVQEATLAEPAFAALPDDPDAEHPTAIVVPDVIALRRWLRDRFVCGHLAGIVPLLHQRTRRGPRALWGTASDTCSGALALLAEIEGTLEAAGKLDRESHAFLSSGPPLIDSSPLRPIIQSDRLVAGWKRVTCCLAYRLPNHGLCTSCPCVNQDEREQRIRAQLEQRPKGGAQPHPQT